MLTHVDLFSGIGGFALAARWAGIKTVQFVEIDKFCQKVLKKNFPGVPIHNDIKTFKYSGASPFILTGGFPCQPFSFAGKRKGKEDDRYLWPAMFDVIQETKSNWVIIENVTGIDGMVLDGLLFDLEAVGYETAPPLTIPACAVNSPQQRFRKWVVAHSASCGLEKLSEKYGEFKTIHKKTSNPPSTFTNVKTIYRQRNFGNIRRGDGVSNRVDRLKSLGNAVVPQIPYLIMKAILESEKRG